MIQDRLSYDPLTGIFTWRDGRNSGCIAGTKTAQGYWQIKIDGRVYRAHRLAWFYMHGQWPEALDHRDGNKLNNSISNLRIATPSQNMANRKPLSNVGVRGVFYESRRKKYKVQVYKNRKHLFVGRYSSLDDAVAAAAKVSAQLHGEFAYGGNR